MKSCTRCGAAFDGPGDICPHCQREEQERAYWQAGTEDLQGKVPETPPLPRTKPAKPTNPVLRPPLPEEDVAVGPMSTVPGILTDVPDRLEKGAESDDAPEEEILADQGMTRTKFLTNSILTVGGMIGVGYLALGVRYLFPNLSSTNVTLQDVGPTSAFPVQSPTLKVIQDDGQPDGVYVVNMGSHFLALDFHCTHLNCPVTWYAGVSGIGRYICPCHGSQFTITGAHVAGPAPRPLYRHQLVIQKGRVLVGGIIS